MAWFDPRFCNAGALPNNTRLRAASASRSAKAHRNARRSIHRPCIKRRPSCMTCYARRVSRSIRPRSAFMEPRLGHDFGAVQIHAGAQATESARAIGALAYTMGSHIVFGEMFQPGMPSGKALLAHELTHVVQQGAQAAPGRALSIGSAESRAEREAERTAASWDMGSARHISTAFASPQVQRQVDRRGMGGGASPLSTNGCHTCQIPGGVGVCCLADNAPLVPECFELAKRIIDACPGAPTSCLEQAQCAQCQCIGQKLGQEYCRCTGIV